MRHEIHAVSCKEFDDAKTSKLTSKESFAYHARNMNLFLDLKRKYKEKVAQEFMSHVSRTQRWKNAFSSLKMSDRLNTTECMIQFINANCSLRRWCRNNTMRHRIFGFKTAQSESTMKTAMQQEQLCTEIYGVCSMEVSDVLAKLNGNRKWVDVNIFHLYPFAQIDLTFEEMLNAGTVTLREVMGFKTLIVNFGFDKCEDGTMFSVLFCPKVNGNDSPKHGRPVAFISKPGTDSTTN